MSVDLTRPGDVVITQGDSTGWLSVIKRADPVVQFSDFVLECALEGENYWPSQHLTELRPPDELTFCNDHSHRGACWMGWTITIEDGSQRFVYVIKHYDAQRNSWIGAWPD
jgi:hypothetical protein